jgi:hypothetical protein
MRWIGVLLLSACSASALAFPWMADGENLRGAKYLTPEERKAHVARMTTFRTFAECRAYMDEHNRLVDERAAAQGVKLAPMQGDPCTVMRTMGRVK